MSVIDYLPEVTSEPETFAAIDDVMAALESVPGVLEGRNEIRAANEQMEREYLIGLATIRKSQRSRKTRLQSKWASSKLPCQKSNDAMTCCSRP